MRVAKTYALDCHNIDGDVAHIYEHVVLCNIYNLLNKAGYPYISHIGNVSASTYQKYILLNFNLDRNAAGLIENFLKQNSVDINDELVEQCRRQVGCERGVVYQITDSELFNAEIQKLAKRYFVDIDALGHLPRYDELIYTGDVAESVFISKNINPTQFNLVNANLYIKKPTQSERIVLAVLNVNRYFNELSTIAVENLGGYMSNSATIADCTDDAILIKSDLIVDRDVKLSDIANGLEKSLEVLQSIDFGSRIIQY